MKEADRKEDMKSFGFQFVELLLATYFSIKFKSVTRSFTGEGHHAYLTALVG